MQRGGSIKCDQREWCVVCAGWGKVGESMHRECIRSVMRRGDGLRWEGEKNNLIIIYFLL